MRPSRPLPLPEFIVLVAMIMASVAFSVDSMLPAMGEIAAELTPEAPNRAPLILTAFILGLGAGTLVTGPLSDRFGRRPVVVFGFLLNMAAAAAAWMAPSLELVLLARAVQGVGAAGPRVVCVAIVRDLFEGRRMAQVMSFAMMIFTVVPALAPLMGAGIIALSGWRAIFLAFVLWSALIALWFALRQPETLPPARRRPFSPRTLARGVIEILSIRDVALTIAVQTMVYGMLFGALSTVQPIFGSFGHAAAFPVWFGAISLIAGSASFLNARIVIRLGMRAVVRMALLAELAIALTMSLVVLSGALPPALTFAMFLLFLQSLFFILGLTIGNLNALGMEPLGHLAGLGASVISAVSTVASVPIAALIGFAFDGTPLSLAAGSVMCCAAGLALLRHVKTGVAAPAEPGEADFPRKSAPNPR